MSHALQHRFQNNKLAWYCPTVAVLALRALSCGGSSGPQENRPPTADSGADQTVALNATVTLNGSGSTYPDGDALTYRWTFVARPTGSAAAFADATVVRPSFTVDLAGEYSIRLLVNDGTVDSAPDTVRIDTLNSAPVADAGPDRRMKHGY